MKPIPYGKQEITQEDIDTVVGVLKSDYLTQGPTVEEFEKAFASYVHSPYAAAVSNGTTALHLAVKGLGLKKGEKVITTPITFAATANSVLFCEGEVLFSDIDPNTYNIDPNYVEDLFRKNKENAPKGIIAVSFAGYPADLYSLRQIADKYGAWLLEDACHSPGASFVKNNKTYYSGDCQLADAAVFSFHPVKHIACGEGGMITSKNKDIIQKVKILRTHGIIRDKFGNPSPGGWYHEMVELGFNYRLSDINAALGLSQLKRAEENIKKRRYIAKRYDRELRTLITPMVEKHISHVYHLYVIRTTKRKDLYDYLKKKNIFCQVHYLPVYKHPYYQEFGFKDLKLVNAEKFYETCLSVPMYPSLSKEEQSHVINSINEYENYIDNTSKNRVFSVT